MLNHYQVEKASSLKYSTEPEISASLSGITVMKSIVLKSRFSGSKKFIVDRRGKILPKEKKPVRKYKKSGEKIQRYYSINKSRVKHILQNYINCMTGNRQLFFYTISFPKNTSDNTAHRMLNSWLTTLRTSHGLKNYLWIAERQQNNTIHFHLAIGHYLNIRLVNDVMKNLLHDAIRKQEIEYSHFECSKYNGVDICKDKKTGKVINFAKGQSGKALGRYLTKYITKDKTVFKRQAWQCSKKLTGLFTKYNMTICEFENRFLQKIDVENPLIDTDFFMFFPWTKAPPREISTLLSKINIKAINYN